MEHSERECDGELLDLGTRSGLAEEVQRLRSAFPQLANAAIGRILRVPTRLIETVQIESTPCKSHISKRA